MEFESTAIMHRTIFTFFLLVAKTFAMDPLSDEFIDAINNAQNSWTAGRNFDKNTPRSTIMTLPGVPAGYKNSLPSRRYEVLLEDLPEYFNAQEQWPECKSLYLIWLQSTCASCWALGPVSAMSDRICIHSNGTKQVLLSARYLLSCCWGCGNGCMGGFPDAAWAYWVYNGIVSGGGYGSTDGCQAYPFPPCYEECDRKTPVCKRECDSSSELDFLTDHHFGQSSYTVSPNEQTIMSEIYKNGPVVGLYDVFEDFYSYKRGVYRKTFGEYVAGHAVRILGWGIEYGEKYWLVANSWGDSWGDYNGYFKILRGENECGIEEQIVAGIPE